MPTDSSSSRARTRRIAGRTPARTAHFNIFQCGQCLEKPEILKDESNGHPAIGGQGVASEHSHIEAADQQAS